MRERKQGDITHVMQAILDAPMPAIEIKEALRAGLCDGEASDERSLPG
jgi:hypothetical protein